MWNTLIFGKSVGQLVEEGIQTKVARMTDESQTKLQETLQKIINDSNGGVVFVIIYGFYGIICILQIVPFLRSI